MICFDWGNVYKMPVDSFGESVHGWPCCPSLVSVTVDMWIRGSLPQPGFQRKSMCKGPSLPVVQMEEEGEMNAFSLNLETFLGCLFLWHN